MNDFLPPLGSDSSGSLPGRSGRSPRSRGDETVAAREAVLVPLADVTARPREWLWPSRLALAGLTVLAGDAGVDLDYPSHDLAARVSRGASWPDRPDDAQAAGAVVLVSGDDLAYRLRPRLDAAGAEASRIVVLRAARCGGGAESAFERPISPWRDLALVENVVAQTRECKLLLIAAPPGGPGGQRPAMARELAELFAMVAGLAARQRVAVVAVVEGDGGSTDELRRLGRLGGAVAIWLAVRDEVRLGRRLLIPLIHETGMARESLAYAVTAGRAVWEPEPVPVGDDDEADCPLGRTARRERRDVAAWLLDALASGPVDSKVLLQQAQECGIADRTLRRAASDLGLRPVKQSFDGPWTWRLGGRMKDEG